MKILNATQTKKADDYTIKKQGIQSEDLMERAALACVNWLVNKYKSSTAFSVFCGVGNNGGDGLAIARMLHEKKYKVQVIVIVFSENRSPDFEINYKKLLSTGVNTIDITPENHSPHYIREHINSAVVIDALFGIGLNKPIDGWIADVVDEMNRNAKEIISIDIPSGLFADDNSSNTFKSIIKANFTLTFQYPKICFLLPTSGKYVGDFNVLDIGIDADFINNTTVTNFYITLPLIQSLYIQREKYSHKGTHGKALLIAGSYGKVGAAIIATKACLRSGAGLLTTFAPNCAYTPLQSSVPEAMVISDASEKYVSQLPSIEGYNAIAVGPGIGLGQETQNALKLLIQNSSIPLVLDADAINIISENKTWYPFLPSNSIITPHLVEFERLLGTKIINDEARIRAQKEFSIKYGVYIILKGPHTSISTPDGNLYFNSTGNEGLAKGGTGDALTGILLGLLAQKYSPLKASLLGVFLHGLAGDIAASRIAKEAILATDVIENISNAYLTIKG